MVSLHEQLAPLAYAPPPLIPLFDSKNLGHPADGIAFRTLMVGGREHTHRELIAPLAEFGLALIPQHWHADRARMPFEVPKGTEIMLMITTVMGHELSNHARGCAQRAGIPYVGISTKSTSWQATLTKRYGLHNPPLWRGNEPAPVLEAIRGNRTSAGDLTRATADPFYKAFREARRLSQLSQSQVAEKLQAKSGTVSNWECGHSTPRFPTYRLLLDVLPALRNFPPPVALGDRVTELLTPTPEQIAEAAPIPLPPPLLSPIAELGVRYAEAIAEGEAHKRLADDSMRAAEAQMDLHKAATERADVLKMQIFELATKGA